jgi:hypothetical protein
MKYALLIYSEKARAGRSDAELQADREEYLALFNDTPGVFGGAQLHPVAMSTTVRVEGGQSLLTDGPFIEAKEYLGGIYLLEAPDLDAATAFAARIPAARIGGAVEVRPIMAVEVRPVMAVEVRPIVEG